MPKCDLPQSDRIGSACVKHCAALQGDLIATGSMDNTAKLWDVETGSEICTLLVPVASHLVRGREAHAITRSALPLAHSNQPIPLSAITRSALPLSAGTRSACEWPASHAPTTATAAGVSGAHCGDRVAQFQQRRRPVDHGLVRPHDQSMGRQVGAVRL